MPAYEAGIFQPPAPVVRATVRGTFGRVFQSCPFLIDTGADVSLVPLEVANAVNARTSASLAPIQFLAGEQVTCLQVDLAVEFLQYRFRGPFLVAESAYGILGRNILNLLVTTLDGPSQVWSV